MAYQSISDYLLVIDSSPSWSFHTKNNELGFCFQRWKSLNIFINSLEMGVPITKRLDGWRLKTVCKPKLKKSTISRWGGPWRFLQTSNRARGPWGSGSGRRFHRFPTVFFIWKRKKSLVMSMVMVLVILFFRFGGLDELSTTWRGCYNEPKQPQGQAFIKSCFNWMMNQIST